MCQSEKIRENIINERQEAIAKIGCYEDLEKPSKRLGSPLKIKTDNLSDHK